MIVFIMIMVINLKKRMGIIYFVLAFVCLFVSINTNLNGNTQGMGTTWLCLGNTFLFLGVYYVRKSRNDE